MKISAMTIVVLVHICMRVIVCTAAITSTCCQAQLIPDPVKTNESVFPRLLDSGRSVLTKILGKSKDETKDFKVGYKFEPKLFKRLQNTFVSINKIKIPFRPGTAINDAFHNPISLVQVPASLSKAAAATSVVSSKASALPLVATTSTPTGPAFSDTPTVNNLTADSSEADDYIDRSRDTADETNVALTAPVSAAIATHCQRVDNSLKKAVPVLSGTIKCVTTGDLSSITSSNGDVDSHSSGGSNTQLHDSILPFGGGGFNQPFNVIGYAQQQPAGVIQRTGGFQFSIGRLVHLQKHHSKVVAYGGRRK